MTELTYQQKNYIIKITPKLLVNMHICFLKHPEDAETNAVVTMCVSTQGSHLDIKEVDN